MLILLPPSEGKASPDALPEAGPLDLAALSVPELLDARRTMLSAMLDASGREDAPELFGVSAGLGALVAANLDVPVSRVGPAALVYTGVLYDAARLGGLVGGTADDKATGSLSPAAAPPLGAATAIGDAVTISAAGLASAGAATEVTARLGRDVLIASALYGMVSPLDLIAPYRMNMAARPPALGNKTPAAFWRRPLRGALDGRVSGDVVVDARSGAYAATWRPPADADHIGVRVEREVDGVRKVVSHSAKHLRGVLAGHLLRREGAAPRSAEEVLAAARELLGEQVGTPSTPFTLIDADLMPGKGAAPDQLVLVTR